MNKANPPLALIAGPTASGKSALALALAERADGVIINADSAQIYRDLPILSAAPSPDDRRRAKHRLYGIRDGAIPCSAADWAQLARGEIAEVHAERKLPILVGGTGLYLRTLLDGIAPIPPIDPEIRQRVRSADVAANRSQLEGLDPVAAARLNAGDKTRIARALEIILSTGESVSSWQERREGAIGEQISLRPLILLPPRDWLNKSCDERFAAMMSRGAIEEVRTLLERNLDPQLPVMRAIGVREVSAYLAGVSSLEEAIAAGQLATRQYAKRQFTWFANQPPTHWPRWAESLDGDPAAALALLQAKA